MTQTDAKHVWDLVKDIHTAILITQDEGLSLRPMGAIVRPDENRIYFLTNAQRDKDREIERQSQVALSFQDGSSYIALYGDAVVTNDRAKIHDVWNVFAKAWWDSADDPDIRLIAVTPHSAEYWETPGKAVAYAKMLVSAATGAKLKIGENRTVAL